MRKTSFQLEEGMILPEGIVSARVELSPITADQLERHPQRTLENALRSFTTNESQIVVLRYDVDLLVPVFDEDRSYISVRGSNLPEALQRARTVVHGEGGILRTGVDIVAAVTVTYQISKNSLN